MSAILDHLTRLESQIAQARGRYPDKELEIEARFFKITEKGSRPLSSTDFYRFTEHLETSKVIPVKEYSEDSSDGSIRKTVIQKGTGEPEVLFRRKIPLSQLMIDPYGVKIAINHEKLLDQVSSSFQPKITRVKHRLSYFFHASAFRLDLTTVQMIDEKKMPTTRYEMEVELLDFNQMKGFLSAVNGFIRALHGTEIIYSSQLLNEFTIDLKKLFRLNDLYGFNKNVLVQARNLQREDMVFGGIVGNPMTPYCVTHKADGQRKLLVFHPTGLWAVMPPYEYNRLTPDTLSNLYGTCLDGEMIPLTQRQFDVASPPKSKYWFLAFDCVALQRELIIQDRLFQERNHICKEVAIRYKNPLITITAKDTFAVSDVLDFFSRMSSMLVQQKMLAYKTDGFMFTPLQTIYNLHTDKYPLSSRVLTHYPDIVKWKPSEELTIDFAVVKKLNPKPDIKLYSSAKGQGPVEFKGTSGLVFSSDMVDRSHPLLEGLPAMSVVEFYWDSSQEKLVPKKLRLDKPVGNDIQVAHQIWNDIFYSIPANSLQGRDYTYFLSLVNRTIQQLLVDKKNIFVWTRALPWIAPCLIEAASSKNITIISSDEEDIPEPLKKASTLDSAPDCVLCLFHSSIPDKIWKLKDTFPIYFVGFDESIILKKYTKERIKTAGLKVHLDLDKKEVTVGSQNVPLTPLPRFDLLKSRAILDTWTLNYEKMMSAEEKELSRWVRVTLFDYKKQEEAYFAYPGLRKRYDQYPVHRIWLHVNPDTLDYKQVSGPNTILDEVNVKLNTLSCYEINNPRTYEVQEEDLNAAPEDIVAKITLPAKQKVSSEKIRYIIEPEESPVIQQEEVKVEPVIQQDTEILHMLSDDEVEVVPCSWYSKKVVRIGSIADGSCLLHSVSKGYNVEYQNNNDTEFRTEYVHKLRYGLAEFLDYVDPEDPDEKTFYETAGQGNLAALGRQLLEKTGESIEDFSQQAIENLFKSENYLGDEVYPLITQILGINIYVVRATSKDIYKHISAIYPRHPQWSVIIQGNGIHYETIGIQTAKGIQTAFEPHHPFLKALESKAEGYK